MRGVSLLLILLLFVGGVTAQELANHYERKELEVKQFVLKNRKKINRFYKKELTSLILDVRIDPYTRMLEEYSLVGQMDSMRRDSLVFWPPLVEKVQQTYFFNPSYFVEEDALFVFGMYDIQLSKKLLKQDIQQLEQVIEKQKSFLIAPNSAYTMQIDSLQFCIGGDSDEVLTIPKLKFKGVLDGYRSPVYIINEGKQFALHFSVQQGMNDERNFSKIDMRLYYIYEDVEDDNARASDLIATVELIDGEGMEHYINYIHEWQGAGENSHLGFIKIYGKLVFK